MRRDNNLATFMWQLLQNLGASTSRNLVGLSRPVTSIALLLPNLVLIRKFAEEETFRSFKHETMTTIINYITMTMKDPCDKGCVNSIVFM